MSHADMQTKLSKVGKSPLRIELSSAISPCQNHPPTSTICLYKSAPPARVLPGRAVPTMRTMLSIWFHPHYGRRPEFTQEEDNEIERQVTCEVPFGLILRLFLLVFRNSLQGIYPGQWTKVASFMDKDPYSVKHRYKNHIFPKGRGLDGGSPRW